MAAAGCIGFTGFTLVMPFLPLFFQQLGVTDIGEIAMWSGLSLGVTPALTEHSTDYDTMLAAARRQILERGLAQPGERLVVTAGVPFDMPGTTNLLKIEAV